MIADAGVYDFAAHHDQILVPVVFKHWRIEQLQNLKSAAEQARERLVKHVEKVGNVAKRMKSRLAPPSAPASRSGLKPAVALAERVPSNCARPRSTIRSCAHAIAGRPTTRERAQQRRPELERPRQPRLGAAVDRRAARAGPDPGDRRRRW